MVVFLGTFAALTVFTIQISDNANDSSTEFGPDAAASRLADTILSQAGEGWYSSLACSDGEPDPSLLDPESVQRFGLGAEVCPGGRLPGTLVLSLDKMRDLADADMETDAGNGHLDYEEARSSLGLDVAGENFHLRTWPILPDLADNLDAGYLDPNLKVAYLGAYDSVIKDVTQFIIDKTCSKTVNAASVDVWVDVHNNGTTSAAVEVVLSVPLETRTIDLRKHVGPIASGSTTRVSFTLPKSSDWTWAGTPQVSLSINDAIRVLGTCDVSLSGVTMTAATSATIYNTYSEHLENVLTSGSVASKIYYNAFNGRGQSVNVAGWTLLVESTLGVPLASDLSLNTRGWETLSLLVSGDHVLKLKSSLGVVLAQNVVSVVATTLPSFTPTTVTTTTYEPQDPVVPEAAYLAALVSQFTPNVFAATYTNLSLPYQLGGDIYPAIYDSVANDLTDELVDDKGTPDDSDDEATLGNYDVLVVGSALDHAELNSVAFRNAVRDWVQLGGTLIVFGSDAQNATWLEPIFLSALSTAGSGLSTPDPAHPVLLSPNALDFASYTTESVAWTFTRDEDSEHFSHVITSGSGDALAVSDPGSLGKGNVFLSAVQPWDIQGGGSTGDCDPTALTGDCEALKYVQNLLTISYRELFLDYGPEIPPNERVSAVTRIAVVPHRDLGFDVELIVQLHVFS